MLKKLSKNSNFQMWLQLIIYKLYEKFQQGNCKNEMC